MDFKKWRWDLSVLGVAVAIFFVTASVLAWKIPLVYNSPDENANATFATSFSQNGRLWLEEPLNAELRGLLHPRSVIAVGVTLVPGSFLGLPMVYGLIGKLVGARAVLFLTPLLAALTIFAWRSVVEKLTGSRRVALIASLAVLFHPAFWYYTAHGMMHNVPFVIWLILAAYFLISPPLRGWVRGGVSKNWTSVAAGVCLALALWFRTVEAVWILPVVAVLFICYHKFLGKRAILLTVIAFVLTLAPLLIINRQLYGGPTVTGYTFDAGDRSTIVATAPETPARLDPFQPNPRTVAKHIWQYGVALFPWMSIAALIGFAIAWKKKLLPRTYLWLTLVVSAWLFAFYGSWVFHDNPDPSLATIGTSYVRYWLPIFVLISPFVAQFICWIADRLRPAITVPILTILLIALNIHPVFFAADGLIKTRQNLFSYADTRQTILELTSDNAIIIVDRADKFIWPARRVVVPLRSEETYAAMPMLIDFAPLYYFGITFPQTGFDYLNNEKLEALGLSIALVETIGQESLYAITR